MRAFVITGPGRAEVQQVPRPEPRTGEVVVDVERAGVCGTDVEVFTGEMSYLHDGQAAYPVRIGHEWAGTVASVGPGVDESWVGRRVTGDTMLGCGACDRCVRGKQHLCADRYEIGIRHGWPGALAEQLPVPVTALVPLPDHMDAALGALVEPGGNALRAVLGADVGPGDRLLVLGPGTIGLLSAQVAAARGVEVHLLGRDEPTLEFARSLGFGSTWTRDTLPALRWDAVLDASGAAALPALAVDVVEPGGRVVFIGIAPEPSLVDSRALALQDVTAVGVLSASGGLSGTVELYASGAVDPRPLVAATVGLDEVASVLAGQRDPAWGAGPKVHVDPRL
ncbi:zinc-dependent alcohol dehydrogenase [Motilibacter deserti]|uniref:Alcohol dehydrogenase catalytic domain-containing protein n=1 Tax=Motilibacter deserti TaxID=2714956 RepID=A0ABX0GYM5_9ACTN|nr:alcohol dehydrogenase catalytic domain-containing protein [Motilibacter deserti]NHC15907.1 alcohol dehydrogenase catalytic domain-containing protein [Motilibacter deserti]